MPGANGFLETHRRWGTWHRFACGRKIARAKSSAAINSPITISSPRPPYSIMPMAKNSRFISPGLLMTNSWTRDTRHASPQQQRALHFSRPGEMSQVIPVVLRQRLYLFGGCIFSEACRCSFRFRFFRSRTKFSRRGISKTSESQPTSCDPQYGDC